MPSWTGNHVAMHNATAAPDLYTLSAHDQSCCMSGYLTSLLQQRTATHVHSFNIYIFSRTLGLYPVQLLRNSLLCAGYLLHCLAPHEQSC